MRTTCVRGIASAIRCMALGRLSNGNTAPENKNMGDNNPVKKKLKWLMFFTIDVIHSDKVANIMPHMNPTKAAIMLSGVLMIPSTQVTIRTAREKKKPLVPANSISPRIRLRGDSGAPSMPSYTLSNSRRINVP